jgi:hypothetical protein
MSPSRHPQSVFPYRFWQRTNQSTGGLSSNSIPEIRDGNINTEVVFYSAAGVGKLRDAVRARDLDGVYCRGRDDITADVLPIIDSTIRKVLDLENSRGLLWPS